MIVLEVGKVKDKMSNQVTRDNIKFCQDNVTMSLDRYESTPNWKFIKRKRYWKDAIYYHNLSASYLEEFFKEDD